MILKDNTALFPSVPLSAIPQKFPWNQYRQPDKALVSARSFDMSASASAPKISERECKFALIYALNMESYLEEMFL